MVKGLEEADRPLSLSGVVRGVFLWEVVPKVRDEDWVGLHDKVGKIFHERKQHVQRQEGTECGWWEAWRGRGAGGGRQASTPWFGVGALLWVLLRTRVQRVRHGGDAPWQGHAGAGGCPRQLLVPTRARPAH